MKSQSHPFKHLRTILRHRRAVFRHCVLAGIPWQGIKHDLSKFSPSEFIPSARHYDGTRSPNELERAEYGCSFAWMHHKGRNKHHFEYWTDYSPITKRMSPVKMPLRYVVEMFCDRVGRAKPIRGKRTLRATRTIILCAGTLKTQCIRKRRLCLKNCL